MADRQPRQKTIELEYCFDRLLGSRLAQAYQLLVPDRVRVTGKRAHEEGRTLTDEISGDLCPGLFGATERRLDDQESDLGPGRGGEGTGLPGAFSMDLRRRRL